VLIYSKAALTDAGLDPEIPDTPRVDDFWAWNQQLVRKDADGNVVRVGKNPGAWEYFNGWAGILGTRIYNEDRTKLAVNSAESVAALSKWIELLPAGIAYDDISNLLAGAPTSTYGTLGAGMEAIINDGFWSFMALDKYWPDLDYGMAKLPTPSGTKEEWNLYSGWVWDPTIPKGSKHPDEAWAFVKYGYWEHGEMLADTLNWTSAVKCFPEFEKRLINIMGESNRMRPYLHHFSEAQYAGGYFVPYTPIFQQLNDALNQAVDQALRGQKQPQEALDEVVATMQPELDKVMAEG
jgi:multiple sugar transport system substrate-binding protein